MAAGLALGFKMRLQFEQIYGPSRGAAFGSLFWGCFIVWYKEVPFLGSPSGLQNGARSSPRIHVFFGPKEEPQTQLVVISCSWVLLWFGVPCFGALRVGESSSYLGDPQKLHVWQSEKHV